MLPYVSRQVRAVIHVQWYSAMRPGDVCIMRTRDLEKDFADGAAWIYPPESHKTEHLAKGRHVMILPEV